MDTLEFKNYFDENYKEFDDFLIDLGVSIKHLDYIKGIKILNYVYPEEYYDFVEEDHNITIPTTNIMKTNLYGNFGYFWYDLIKDSFTKEYKDITANIIPERVWDCFRHLYENGFEKWDKSYLSKPVGGCNYSAFITSKGITHYVHNGGNGGGRHRLFSAKVGGVNYILAQSLKKYKFNPQKAKLYKQIQTQEFEIQSYINSKRDYLKYDKNKLEIICEDPYFNYELGNILIKQKDNFLNEDLAATQSYIEFLKQCRMYLEEIDAIYESNKNKKIIWPFAYLKKKLLKLNIQRDRHKFKDLSKFGYKEMPSHIVKELKLIFYFNTKYKNKFKRI